RSAFRFAGEGNRPRERCAPMEKMCILIWVRIVAGRSEPFMTLETTWQDLRYAIRGMRGNPGFAVTAIASLALGIGASVAIFTLTDNLLLRPLPYREPGQLMMVWEMNLFRGQKRNVVSPANYRDWKARNS